MHLVGYLYEDGPTVLCFSSKDGPVLVLIPRNIAHGMYKFLFSLLGFRYSTAYC